MQEKPKTTNKSDEKEGSIEKGKKLPSYYENPVDLVLLDYCKILNPYFKNLGFSPNGITTLSFVFGLLSCYLYYKQKYILSAILFYISYFFDVMDGNFARTYNMMSEYGAMYDSISDIVVGLTLVYLFVKNKHIKKEFNFFKPLVIFLGIVLYGASMYYLSCQDTYYKENTKDKQLSYSYSGICYKTDHLSFVKYFGVGTLYLFIALTIASHIFVTKNKSLLYRY